MVVHIDNRHFWVGIDSGILYFTYKNGVIIDLPLAIKSVSYRLSVQNGKNFPVLCDVSGVRYIGRSARIYLSVQGSQLIKALAFISRSRSTSGITQFYLSFNSSSIPTRIFKGKDVALRFLRSI